MGDGAASEMLPATQETALNTQLATIRAEIGAKGESIANGANLLVLCPEVAISGQWGEIAKIAISENWSFTFLPNGDVRFAPLSAPSSLDTGALVRVDFA